MKKSSGLFITFEGGEGAGKTTLIEGMRALLQERAYPVVVTREPGGTPFGEKIRDIVLHRHDLNILKRSELFLFLTDRAQHVEELIRPSLEEGCIVLCDRYIDSTFAYQGARGFDETLLRQLCDVATGGLYPERTFYLDLDPHIGLKRVEAAKGGRDRIEQEKLDFHQKIRLAFHRFAKQEPERIQMIDAQRSAHTVLSETMEVLSAILSHRR